MLAKRSGSNIINIVFFFSVIKLFSMNDGNTFKHERFVLLQQILMEFLVCAAIVLGYHTVNRLFFRMPCFEFESLIIRLLLILSSIVLSV